MTASRDYDLVTVYMASLPELLVLQARLACDGVDTSLADEAAFVADPMMLSGGTMGCELMTTRHRVASTIEAIRELRRHATTLPPRDAAIATVESLGARIRFASLFCISAPFVLWMMARYLVAIRRGPRARQHGAVLAAGVLSLPMTALGVAGAWAIVTDLIVREPNPFLMVLVIWATANLKMRT